MDSPNADRQQLDRPKNRGDAGRHLERDRSANQSHLGRCQAEQDRGRHGTSPPVFGHGTVCRLPESHVRISGGCPIRRARTSGAFGGSAVPRGSQPSAPAGSRSPGRSSGGGCHSRSMEQVSVFRLRLGLILIGIWWIPIWLLAPLVSHLVDRPAGSITIAIAIVQTHHWSDRGASPDDKQRRSSATPGSARFPGRSGASLDGKADGVGTDRGDRRVRPLDSLLI